MKKIIGICFLVFYLTQLYTVLLVLFCNKSAFENKNHYLKHQLIPFYFIYDCYKKLPDDNLGFVAPKENIKLELRNLNETLSNNISDTFFLDVSNETITYFYFSNNNYECVSPVSILLKKDFSKLKHNKIIYGSMCPYCHKMSHFTNRLINQGEVVSGNDFFYSNGNHPKNKEQIHCEYCNKGLDYLDLYLNRYGIIWE